MNELVPERTHGSSGVAKEVGTYTVGKRAGLFVLTVLFFVWGFITSLNDILVPHLKSAFELNYTKAILVQFSFFAAYFLVSVPAGLLIRRVGYQLGIVLGLLIACAGCLLFIPAARMHVYMMFLLGLFVLASGIAILQVSANPYVIALGRPESAPSRLNLTQAFNSLGTSLAPIFGALVIFSAGAGIVNFSSIQPGVNYPASEAASVEIPYFWLSVVLLVLVAFFSWVSLPSIKVEEELPEESSARAFGIFEFLLFPRLALGAVAIFFYVGAEVAIGSFLVSYLTEKTVGDIGVGEAARYVSLYWAGAMIGRFIGAGLLKFVRPGALLATCGFSAVLLISLSITSEGPLAVWTIVAVGLCNSIMFPTIFSLALGGLRQFTSQGSGVLCMAIVGGAIVPLLQGITADSAGIRLSFVVPLICYCYIVYYGAFSPFLRNRK
ncbi:sugar MFS transporter [Microbulbifer agarilyticus]|uniref:sugar MFS transporter n=1 Tax=Microbulbifer agarilyticus TaxID=260552 RepID=UPI001CD6D9D1|nr:sugar MFS transporter [Microbulbifer agarilyticus]MCA0899171.1 sugar MFS transporter [Microbulbifer agarilyticus]